MKQHLRILEYPIGAKEEGLSVEAFLRLQGYSKHVIIHLRRTDTSQEDSAAAFPDTIYGLSINGQKVYTTHLLQTGETLRISLLESSSSEQIEETQIPLNIVYEDEDLLVINKPAGMPIHPSQGNHTYTLGNALAWYAHHSLGYPNFVYRVINRLDRDTTGLLIVAKNMLSAAVLGQAVKDREIHREYRALCCGQVQGGIIDAPIARAEGSTIERCIDQLHGERAVTHVRLLSYDPYNDLSLVALKLETGRTHQIRVHMKYIGHPLPGDFLYHPDYRLISRQALHSAVLSFRHPVSKKELRFEAPLPEDMQRLLPPVYPSSTH